MAQPATFPEWADSDLLDPTSGVNNVTTPPAGIQANGWNPAGVFPLRQHDNWFKRWVSRWLKWTRDELAPQVNYLRYLTIVEAETTSFDFSEGAIPFDIYCIRNILTIDGIPQTGANLDELVTLTFPEITGTSIATILRLQPRNHATGGEWPSWFIHAFQQAKSPFLWIDDGNIKPGSIEMPANATARLICRIIDSSNNLVFSTGFTASGSKGFQSQTITVRNVDLSP
jgi:hypothetical protein